ncbi:hypothetical protein DL89DRAFT_218845, partial [Linderina pennispora]
KTQDKEKKKVIEDKTFGLKNKKKSKKVGEYVKQVEQQVMTSGSRKDRKQEEERKNALTRKKEEEKQKLEMLELFKPIQTQKVPFGVNPKSVLCQFFKAGGCSKGDRCKFSHDLSVERKGQKLDIYTDKRDGKEETMEDWDQSQLEEVVLSKHGNPKTTTTIVCKHFLAAIESSKYGWFWECPNGGDKCIYKHALPPGFVLKKDKKKDEDKDEISLEEFLETERHKLGDNLTPVTLESFTKWKADRKARKEAEEAKAKEAKAKAFKAGKAVNMSGRDFFEFNPELDAGDNDDGDEFDFSQYKTADGGYQQDEHQQEAEEKGAQNEDLFAAEDVGDISDD